MTDEHEDIDPKRFMANLFRLVKFPPPDMDPALHDSLSRLLDAIIHPPIPPMPPQDWPTLEELESEPLDVPPGVDPAVFESHVAVMEKVLQNPPPQDVKDSIKGMPIHDQFERLKEFYRTGTT